MAEIVGALGARGTKAVVVISAGFAELGEAGRALQQAMLDAAKPHTLRLVGPNCLGVQVPGHGLNASFAQGQALPGDLAFVSQSGAVLASVLDWASARRIGFSHLVSLGGAADVDFGDLLDYLAIDRHTRAILLYVEAITEARKFMSAARAAARSKPVVVIKAGRSQEAARAAQSHTGALAGSDEVYEAAFARAGMLRVETLDELFAAVETLGSGVRVGRRPARDRLQRRRHRRAGDRQPDPRRRPARRARARDGRAPRRRAAADLEPRQSDRSDRRCARRALCRGARGGAGGSRQRCRAGAATARPRSPTAPMRRAPRRARRRRTSGRC